MPSISTAVTSSNVFNQRVQDLKLKGDEDPLYHELMAAHILVVKDALLERANYDIGMMSTGNAALSQFYDKLLKDGVMKDRGKAFEYYTVNLAGLGRIADGVRPEQVIQSRVK